MTLSTFEQRFTSPLWQCGSVVVWQCGSVVVWQRPTQQTADLCFQLPIIHPCWSNDSVIFDQQQYQIRATTFTTSTFYLERKDLYNLNGLYWVNRDLQPKRNILGQQSFTTRTFHIRTIHFSTRKFRLKVHEVEKIYLSDVVRVAVFRLATTLAGIGKSTVSSFLYFLGRK